MNIYFVQVYTDATTSHIREVSGGGICREPIDPANIGYTDWLAAGNVPQKVAGNKYVTIGTDGTVTYDSTTATADENAAQWETVRATRDSRLVETDYFLLRYQEQADLVVAGKMAATKNTAAEVLAVKEYRQALRDITTQSDPYNIAWPTKPECLS